MINDYIKAYISVREARSKLDEQVSILKQKEAELKDIMIATLKANGLDTVKEKVEVGGSTLQATVSITHTTRAEIKDHAKLQEAMFELMNKAHEEGRPLQDGLLLQRTVSKSSVLDVIHKRLGLAEDADIDVTDPKTISEAERLGLRLVDLTDLSIRKK